MSATLAHPGSHCGEPAAVHHSVFVRCVRSSWCQYKQCLAWWADSRGTSRLWCTAGVSASSVQAVSQCLGAARVVAGRQESSAHKSAGGAKTPTAKSSGAKTTTKPTSTKTAAKSTKKPRFNAPPNPTKPLKLDKNYQKRVLEYLSADPELLSECSSQTGTATEESSLSQKSRNGKAFPIHGMIQSI